MNTFLRVFAWADIRGHPADIPQTSCGHRVDTSANVRQSLPQSARVRHSLPEYATVRQSPPKSAISFKYLYKIADIGGLWQTLAESGELCRILSDSDELWWTSADDGGMCIFCVSGMSAFCPPRRTQEECPLQFARVRQKSAPVRQSLLADIGGI